MFHPVLFAIAFMPALSEATTFVSRPFPDTVQDAPAIVRGRVGAGHSDWASGPDGTRRIYTFYDLEVNEVFKGDVPDRGAIQMREIGGAKDGVGLEVPGAAFFRPGEDIVVFLGPENPDESYDVWGMMMGKYSVQKDSDGNEILSGPGLQPGEGQPGTAASKWTLDALRQLVREQRGGDRVSKKTPEKTTASATPLAPAVAAPRLQSSPVAEVPKPANRWIWVGFGILALGVILGLCLS